MESTTSRWNHVSSRRTTYVVLVIYARSGVCREVRDTHAEDLAKKMLPKKKR